MAELFGVAAGVAGFVSLSVQIGEGVNKLRTIRDSAGKAATDISNLIRELDLLAYVMQDVIACASSRNDSVIQHCQADCDQVVRDLKSLIAKLPPTSRSTTKANALKFIAFRDWTETVTALQRSIQGAKINLILNSNQLKELTLISQLHTSKPTPDHPKEPVSAATCDFVQTITTSAARFALSRFGIKWAAMLECYIVSATGKLSLRPNLAVERIVPYGSLGFELITRCMFEEITLEDASAGFRQLYRTDPYFRHHVNPGGESYIECRFLNNCAGWISMGPYMDLLNVLLDLGYDAIEGGFQYWPQPYWPTWALVQEANPDPFFIQYLAAICEHSQGFAAMTPLHEAVLFASTDELRTWISKSGKDERNSLGQTPLHLAVLDSKRLEALVHSGHNVNSIDNYGLTPLMYAASLNKEDSAIILLESGADLNFKADLRVLTFAQKKLSFLYFAARRDHWRLIYNLITRLETYAGKVIMRSWARKAVVAYLANFSHHPRHLGREISLHQLLAMCGSVNFTYDNAVCEYRKNECLLHATKTVEDFDTLVEAGLKLFDHADYLGQTPLMIAVKSQSPDLVIRLLDLGANPALRDIYGRTAFASAIHVVERRHEPISWPGLEVLGILFTQGKGVIVTDRCSCPCSPSGCLPGTNLAHEETLINPPVGTMEYLSLVLEHEGTLQATELLLSLIRKEKHHELGITHTCCERHWQHNGSEHFGALLPTYLLQDDVKEILDEESEFLEILETEMDDLVAKDYETLLVVWFTQIKRRFDKTCEAVMRENNARKARHRRSKNHDCNRWARPSIDTYIVPDPKMKIVASFSAYIAWIENEYRRRAIRRLAGPIRKNCTARISLIFKLANVLGIPPTIREPLL
ncbi:hypothetical protein CFIO01_09569 [Colletotrichum fioriniae PJ7]|uniref:Uncharacterized protein n=1 Tax=Colletotrichum fioriniae PJ7 TaxID=1445577 RepID=A0A010RMV2_9PEZI|nr:hypothetical protein CFIO01_09569 [Colletotrichum fioriniae PJ7]